MLEQVTVSANARLHMGFLDLNGALGRRFGSIGVAIDDLRTQIKLTSQTDIGCQQLAAIGPDAERAKQYAHSVCSAMGIKTALHIEVVSAVKPHAGLGSGTQLALAVGLAISRLAGREDTPEQIATLLGRGKRSSIGVACFQHGGFVIDGGKGPSAKVPPLLARHEFPQQWRLILLLDNRQTGVHGAVEHSAFADLPALSDGQAAHLCRLALMRLLPGLVEKNISEFGAAITEIQEIVGDHFSPVQGGRFASPMIAKLLDWFRFNGAPGVGQSSWGPTGFVICPDAKTAQSWMNTVENELALDEIDMILCRAANLPGTIATSDISGCKTIELANA